MGIISLRKNQLERGYTNDMRFKYYEFKRWLMFDAWPAVKPTISRKRWVAPAAMLLLLLLVCILPAAFSDEIFYYVTYAGAYLIGCIVLIIVAAAFISEWIYPREEDKEKRENLFGGILSFCMHAALISLILMLFRMNAGGVLVFIFIALVVMFGAVWDSRRNKEDTLDAVLRICGTLFFCAAAAAIIILTGKANVDIAALSENGLLVAWLMIFLAVAMTAIIRFAQEGMPVQVLCVGTISLFISLVSVLPLIYHYVKDGFTEYLVLAIIYVAIEIAGSVIGFKKAKRNAI